MKVNLENTYKDWFSSILGSAAMVYAGYGWHVDWLTAQEAGIVAFIGFVLLFLRMRLTQVISDGLGKIFEAVMDKIFRKGGGPPASIFILLMLASFYSYGQQPPVNTREIRIVNKTDSVGINGIGIVRWDGATGKFRFWNGTAWGSFVDTGYASSVFWKTSGTTTITNPTLTGNATFTGGVTSQGILTLGASGQQGRIDLRRAADGGLTGQITQEVDVTRINNIQGSGLMLATSGSDRMTLSSSVIRALSPMLRSNNGSHTLTAGSSMDIRGTGNTTNLALRVADSNNNTVFSVSDAGAITAVASTTGNGDISLTADDDVGIAARDGDLSLSTPQGGGTTLTTGGLTATANGSPGITFSSANSSNATAIFNITGSPSDVIPATLSIARTFNPSTATTDHNFLRLTPTWNTAGTYSGNVRGLYYNPTNTTLIGATHIAYENTSGQLRFGGITQDDTKTQMLAKDATTNQVFWRDAATLGGGGDFWNINGETLLGTDFNPIVVAGSSGFEDVTIGIGNGTTSLDFSTFKLGTAIGNLNLTATDITFTDNRATSKGIEYAADYSVDFTDRSLADWGSVWKDRGTTTISETAEVIGDFSGASPGSIYLGSNTVSATEPAAYVGVSGTGGEGTESSFITWHADNTSTNYMQFSLSGTAASFEDVRTITKGIEYGADYSAGFTDRSLADWGNVWKAFGTTAITNDVIIDGAFEVGFNFSRLEIDVGTGFHGIDAGVASIDATEAADITVNNGAGQTASILFSTSVTGEITMSASDLIQVNSPASTLSGGRYTYVPTATVAAINIGAVGADPSAPIDADIWYNTAGTDKIKARVGGATVDVITSADVSSGTWSTTPTGIANVDNVSVHDLYYQRIGNIVEVSGWLQVDATTGGGTSTQIDMSLPAGLLSNFTTAYQASGTGMTSTDDSNVSCLSDSVGDNIRVSYNSDTTNAQDIQITFKYRIL